jgi:hypothetical protein
VLSSGHVQAGDVREGFFVSSFYLSINSLYCHAISICPGWIP